MGLEANAELITDAGTVAVRVLLESDALILRGAIRKTLPLVEIVNPHIIDDHLLFEHDGQVFTLALPQAQVVKWLKKLTEAPPSLATKLGVGPDHRVLVHGQVTDSTLNEALRDAVTTDPPTAAQGVIVADTSEGLTAGLAALTVLLPQAPLWIVYPKGAKSTLPESAVRSYMHALGYVDTKVAAVSATLTAARFSKRK